MNFPEKVQIFAEVKDTGWLLVLGLRVWIVFANGARIRDHDLMNLFKALQIHLLFFCLLGFFLLLLIIGCNIVREGAELDCIRLLYLWREFTVFFRFCLLFEYSYGLQNIDYLCLFLHFFDRFDNHILIFLIGGVVLDTNMANGVLQFLRAFLDLVLCKRLLVLFMLSEVI